MSLEEQFRPVEEHNRMVVMAGTWGHPEFNVKYPVKLLIANCESDLLTTVRSDIPEECENWFFWEDVSDVLLARVPDEQGQLYLWEGTYKKLKNGRAIFQGRFRKVDVGGE